MATRVYRMADDGRRVEVQQSSGEWIAPELSKQLTLFFTADRIPGKPREGGVMQRWTEAALRESARTGVPAELLLASVWRESHGDDQLVGNDPGGGHGYGLHMLTSKSTFQGHAPEEVLDGDLNMALAADVFAKIIKVTGLDYPKIMSAFNVGYNAQGPHPSTVSPWGWRESKGHIDEEIAALNTAVRLLPFFADGDPGARGDDSGVTLGEALVAGGALGAAIAVGIALARMRG